MEANNNIQQALFQQVKDQLPSHLSFVDEISDLLEISNDSAYRRIRGEKELSLKETQKVCCHFKISFDTFINNTSDVIPFYQVSFKEEEFNLKKYLNTMLDNLTLASKADEKEIIYVTNDLTIFQLFQIPELATFKLYFWGKTGMGFSRFEDVLFSMDLFKEMHETIEKIAKLYVKIPTIEIIGEDSINSLLLQVKYNLVSGFFKKKEDALLLCDKYSELVRHFQKQSELGYKFLYGTKPAGIEGNYTLYYNEIMIVDGIILLRIDDNRISYITTNPMNYIHTTNSNFYETNYNWIKNLIKKSVLISSTSEKERNRFFLRAQKKISDLKKEIE